MRRLPFYFILVVLLASPAVAQEMEREARAIEAMLVAPCCWTQQVSLHQSEAATRIKREIRAALGQGRTRDQILDSYVAQYGPAILIEPPARGFGASLYVLPVVALLGSALLVGAVVRRFTRRGQAPSANAAQPLEAGDALSERLDEELRDLD
jgi:cytochrome c-type biogenesis protein CcmH